MYMCVCVHHSCTVYHCVWSSGNDVIDPILSIGHGGENFLKFQDSEEISNDELGDAFEQMWQKKR